MPEPRPLVAVEQESGSVSSDFVLSGIVVCVLMFNGWKGRDMVYSGHAGIAD